VRERCYGSKEKKILFIFLCKVALPGATFVFFCRFWVKPWNQICAITRGKESVEELEELVEGVEVVPVHPQERK
jgi:hypothetical protein